MPCGYCTLLSRPLLALRGAFGATADREPTAPQDFSRHTGKYLRHIPSNFFLNHRRK